MSGKKLVTGLHSRYIYIASYVSTFFELKNFVEINAVSREPPRMRHSGIDSRHGKWHFLSNDPSNQLGAGPFQICPLTAHQCETWLDQKKHNEKDRDKEMLRTPSKRDSGDL